MVASSSYLVLLTQFYLTQHFASANLGKVFVVLGPKKHMAKPQMRTDVNCMSESRSSLGSTTSIPIITDNLGNDIETAANHKLENGID